MIDIVRIYDALDDLHIAITCSSEGEEWFWRNTDTGEEGEMSYSNADDAARAAADQFLSIDDFRDEPDHEYDDGMTDAEADAQVLANAGMGTDEDYGIFHDQDAEYYYDHVERDHDEPYLGDE